MVVCIGLLTGLCDTVEICWWWCALACSLVSVILSRYAGGGVHWLAHWSL